MKRMQKFIGKDFILSNKTAERLYHEYAEKMPIFDYHCHLSEKTIEANQQFGNFFDLWLSGDHYKWRLMRNFGIDEKFITGNASDKEKFMCYAEALETAYGNPLMHWSHMELSSFFGIDCPIIPSNAEKIWDTANAYLSRNNVTPSTIIEEYNVKTVCTTNEIFDDLKVFENIKNKGFSFKVLPTFRGDKIMNIDDSGFIFYLDKLRAVSGEIQAFEDLERVILQRIEEFKNAGAVSSDIAVTGVYPPSTRDAARCAFERAIDGNSLTKKEIAEYKSYIMEFIMRGCACKDLAVQLHIGAMRNNNTRMYRTLGADTGFDSMDDGACITNLSCIMDRLNQTDELPRMVLFNLNPIMNGPLTTLTGCFQDSSARGKIQYGPAWWFLDHEEGMREQMNSLAQTGHIAIFIGMLTDSRSFLSYPRHQYFRRILCDWLGRKAEAGEILNDMDTLGDVVRNISYNNAINYFKV